jgi:hypothetical protein
MITMAIVAMLTGASLPQQHLDIANRVAGEGKPACQSYHPDGTESGCLPVFAVGRGGGVNGWNLAGRITFSTAATIRLNNDEFALLAGHEIAHYYLGHKGSTKAAELAADRLGAELACKAGFDPLSGITLFRHLRPSKVHPTSSERSAAVLKVGCRKSFDKAQSTKM